MDDNKDQDNYEEEEVGDVPEDIEVSNLVISTESCSEDFGNDDESDSEN